MRFRRLLLVTLAVAVATVALSVAAGSADANRLSVGNQSFRMTWSLMIFREDGGSRVECRMTMEGTLHNALMTKTVNGLIGYITRAEVANCTGGSITLLTTGTLPWHVQYGGFIGTLPDITEMAIRIVGLAASIGSCLITTTNSEPAVIKWVRNSGNIVSAQFNSSFSITPTSGVFCIQPWRPSGIGETFVQGSTTTRISLALA